MVVEHAREQLHVLAEDGLAGEHYLEDGEPFGWTGSRSAGVSERNPGDGATAYYGRERRDRASA
jgi:hypothetical protein